MPRPRLWKPFILLASFVFYGCRVWRCVLLLALSAVAVKPGAGSAAPVAEGVGEGHSGALTPPF